MGRNENERTDRITELIFIIDKSGSMHGCESDTVGGFNSILKEQRESGREVLVNTVLFDTHTTVLHDRIPIDSVKDMTEEDYRTGGCTALLDAVGSTLERLSGIRKYLRREDIPGKTLCVINTDGYENASQKYTAEQVKRSVGSLTEQGWEFIYLGADIDAVEGAREIGIRSERAVKYGKDNGGVERCYRMVNCAVSLVEAAEDRVDDNSMDSLLDTIRKK